MKPVAIETVEYYPFLVKGYQNTYPKKSIVVLPVRDARDFKDTGGIGHEPNDGHPAIGVILDESGKVDQRLYGTDLESLVQNALARSAAEAGMTATTSASTVQQALAAHAADYVLAAEIRRCWVNKHRGRDTEAGPTWYSSADTALSVAIYKPPFNVPFWRGDSEAPYADPAATGPNSDDTEIYDHPGQVLSVAVTRAVAGVFKRDDLRSLIEEDSGLPH